MPMPRLFRVRREAARAAGEAARAAGKDGADAGGAAPISRHAMYTLLLALVPVLAPHAERLPGWCSAFAGAMFAWRAWLTWRAARGPVRPPGRWLLILLTFAALAATVYTHRTLFGRDAGVTFVTVLLSLKLLESRTRRDAVVAIFLSYFLILTNFFYSQSIGTGAVMLAALVLITSALIAASRDAAPMPLMRQHRLAAIILAQAFPMMLLLFLLFPRVQGPLWGLPADAQAGVSGLSDSMAPGNITRLSLSDGIAFRVSFSGPPPRGADLYWRGPVLSEFDGRTWRAIMANPMRPARFEAAGPAVDYQVTLEPSNRNWLFALEMPTRLPDFAKLTADLQPVADRPVTARLRYGARSYPGYRSVPAEEAADLEPYLALPVRSNPRTRAMMAGWYFENPDPRALVARALQYFRAEAFFYTLEPPLLDNNAVDEFLFGARRGFCEHYASAFVVMMRIARVPARVVTGYQGGEINPVDGVFTVRHSDAHAWAEVWLPGSGWTRVDPTSAVSPARVERGLQGALPERFAPPLIARFAGGWGGQWLVRARLGWEALGNKWNQLVLNYTPDRQRETLERAGMKTPTWQQMVMTLSLGIGTLLLGATLWMLRVARERDPVKREWDRLCARLARRGLGRAAHEGPLDFAARAGAEMTRRALPAEAAQNLRRVAEDYAALRYGPKTDKVALARFLRLARRL
jgi:transglutaminase-like putative cysteine protease